MRTSRRRVSRRHRGKPHSPDAFGTLVKAEISRWGTVICETNVKVDMTMRMTGVFPIAPTPFSDAGDVDLPGQRRAFSTA